MRIIVAMLALAMALVSGSASAVATWEHFNADPAYRNREAAIADAPKVLRKVGYPEPVISLLTEAMKNPGVETHVTNGMKLDFMRSGKSELWRNVVVKFKKPPRESERNMDFSAPSEEWVVDWNGQKWTAGIPKVCNNIYGKRAPTPTPQSAPPVALAPPVAQPPTKPAVPTFTTSECPSGFTLFANAWSLQTLPNSLRKEAEKLIQSANERDSKEATLLVAYQPDDFSRTMGGRLRSDVKVRAPTTADLSIRYLDVQTAKVVRELGVVSMARGVGNFRFSGDPRAYVVEVVFPPDFVSPAMSGGERRVRMFPSEWGKFCAMNVHGALLP